MKSKDVSKSQSIFIPNTSIKNDGFYKDLLGKMNGIENLKIREIADKVKKIVENIYS